MRRSIAAALRTLHQPTTSLRVRARPIHPSEIVPDTFLEGNSGPIWFFVGKPNAVVDNLSNSDRAIAAFSSKGHDLFASIHGKLSVDQDRAVIDRLWNPFIAAWFDGKDDPKLVLLRFDPEHAEVWLNESNMLAGVKMLFGSDPKKDYQDKVGNVDLR